MDTIKNKIHYQLEVLFTEAAVDELIGDAAAHNAALKRIAAVAEILGINTKITRIEFDIIKDNL